MKTTMIIEFETKDMKKVVPEEYIGSDELCPKDEEMQDEIEIDLHQAFKNFLHHTFEENEIFETYILEDCDDLSVEGFEELSDYGDIKITISEENKEVSVNSSQP